MKISARLLVRGKNEYGTIQIAVYHNKQQREFSLGRQLKVEDWDKNQQEAKGKHNQILNALIRTTKHNLYNLLDQMIVNGQEIELNQVIDSYLNKRELVQASNTPTFGLEPSDIALCSYVQSYIEINPDQVSFGTLNTYKVLYNHLLHFNEGLKIKEVTVSVLKTFNQYLVDKGNSFNSVATKMAKLRKILGYAHREKLIAELPFGKYAFQIKKVKDTKVKHLSESEILALFSYIPRTNSEKKVLTLVKFNLHVGLRIGDLLTLKKKDIIVQQRGKEIDYRCTKITSKTHTQTNILLTTQAVGELLANGYEEKGEEEFIFPWLNHNDLLDEAHLYRAISSKTAYFNKVAAVIAKNLGIRAFSTHTIRHTFGTTLINRGVPITSIAKLMGHSSIKTTEIYTHLSQSSLDEHILLVGSKLHK